MGFMVGTAIGFKEVLGAPKNKIVSPFWGTTFYFLGAWTIGIFKFWGPVLVDTLFSTHSVLNASWTWYMGILGAIFLTTGALIFGLMDGTFNPMQRGNMIV